jgi:hypothetical protein
MQWKFVASTHLHPATKSGGGTVQGDATVSMTAPKGVQLRVAALPAAVRSLSPTEMGEGGQASRTRGVQRAQLSELALRGQPGG